MKWMSPPKTMTLTIRNEEIVREILRTLGRMPLTPVVRHYWLTISELAVEVFGRAPFGAVIYDGPTVSEDSTCSLSDAQLDQLRTWLMTAPQYVFSMLVGLATNEGEDTAWAFAYG